MNVINETKLLRNLCSDLERFKKQFPSGINRDHHKESLPEKLYGFVGTSLLEFIRLSIDESKIIYSIWQKYKKEKIESSFPIEYLVDMEIDKLRETLYLFAKKYINYSNIVKCSSTIDYNYDTKKQLVTFSLEVYCLETQKSEIQK